MVEPRCVGGPRPAGEHDAKVSKTETESEKGKEREEEKKVVRKRKDMALAPEGVAASAAIPTKYASCGENDGGGARGTRAGGGGRDNKRGGNPAGGDDSGCSGSTAATGVTATMATTCEGCGGVEGEGVRMEKELMEGFGVSVCRACKVGCRRCALALSKRFLFFLFPSSWHYFVFCVFFFVRISYVSSEERNA